MSNIKIPENFLKEIEEANAKLQAEDPSNEEDEGTQTALLKQPEIEEDDEAIDELPESIEAIDELPEAEEETLELTEAEEEAMKKGWRPKDQYADDPEDFVDAEEYLARGPFIKQIQKQKRELKQMQEAIKDLANTAKLAESRGREKALEELSLEKQLAYQQGNYVKAQQLEKEHQAQLLQQHNIAPEAGPGIDINDIRATADWASFEQENPWIGSDKAEHIGLRQKASEYASQYISFVGEDRLNIDHVPEMIKYIKQNLTPQAAAPKNVRSPVTQARSVSKQAGSSMKADLSKLSPAQKMIINQLDTKQEKKEYLELLKSHGQVQ